MNAGHDSVHHFIAQHSAFLLSVRRDQVPPNGSGLEDQFNRRSRTAPDPPGAVVTYGLLGELPRRRRPPPRRAPPPAPPAYRQIVAHVADLRGRKPAIPGGSRMAASLSSIPCRRISMPNSATRVFTMCKLRCVISPKRYQPSANSRIPIPVGGREPLGLDPLVVEHDAAVGQYAVNSDRINRIPRQRSSRVMSGGVQGSGIRALESKFSRRVYATFRSDGVRRFFFYGKSSLLMFLFIRVTTSREMSRTSWTSRQCFSSGTPRNTSFFSRTCGSSDTRINQLDVVFFTTGLDRGQCRVVGALVDVGLTSGFTKVGALR